MKNIIILFMFLGHLLTLGQESANKVIPKRNTVYLEAFGQGVYNSLSFDRLYRIDKKVKTSFTAGITLIPLLYRSDNILVIGTPISYNWLFGQKKSHFELGVGLTFLSRTELVNFSDGSSKYETESFFYLTPKISYRFQNPSGGLFFRVSFTPPIALIEKSNWAWKHRIDFFPRDENPMGYVIFPWPGLSVGYTLK